MTDQQLKAFCEIAVTAQARYEQACRAENLAIKARISAGQEWRAAHEQVERAIQRHARARDGSEGCMAPCPI